MMGSGFVERPPDRVIRLSDVLRRHLAMADAIAAVPLLAPNADLLGLAERAQDASDRLGLGLDQDSWGALDALTCLVARATGSVAMSAATSPDEVRRRAKAYGRLRCDNRVASVLAFTLERDRRLHRMNLRDLAF